MQAIKHVNLYATEVENGFTLSGYDTFALKTEIKAAGGKWNAETKSWFLKNGALTSVRSAALKLSETREKEKKEAKIAAAAKRIFDLTPEGIAENKRLAKEKVLWALEQNKKTGAYPWICCEECKVIDWVRQFTSCEPCGSGEGIGRNTFRVRGRLYTGD